MDDWLVTTPLGRMSNRTVMDGDMPRSSLRTVLAANGDSAPEKKSVWSSTSLVPCSAEASAASVLCFAVVFGLAITVPAGQACCRKTIQINRLAKQRTLSRGCWLEEERLDSRRRRRVHSRLWEIENNLSRWIVD